MYSSIELTHAQFVRDLSGSVEKDTLINCCHVLSGRTLPSLFVSFFQGNARGGRDATFRVLLEGYCFVRRIGVLAFLRARSEGDLDAALRFVFYT